MKQGNRQGMNRAKNWTRRSMVQKILLALCLGTFSQLSVGYAADATLGEVNKNLRNTTDYLWGYSVPDGNSTIDMANSRITASVDNSTWAGIADGSAAAGGLANYGQVVTLQGSSGQQMPITVTASGGSAVSPVFAVATATAAGITNMGNGSAASMGITGATAITVTATGGRAAAFMTANAEATGTATGITNGSMFNTAIMEITGATAITVTAQGGAAEAPTTDVQANATAEGIRNASAFSTVSSRITGTTAITVTARGGTVSSVAADEQATATAYGIRNANAVGVASTNITGATTITVTAEGGHATTMNAAVAAKAYGIYNTGLEADLEIRGSTTITAIARQGTMHGQTAVGGATAYALYNERGTININQSAGHPDTVQLTGDVRSDTGIINLYLNNSRSYLRGNVIANSFGGVGLTLANGAVWEPVYDDRNGTSSYDSTRYSAIQNTINTLDVAGGSVNLTWDNRTRSGVYRTLAIGELRGSGGRFEINTDLAHQTGDTITVGSLASGGSGSLSVGVGYDPSLAAVTRPTTLYFTGYTPILGATGATISGAMTETGAYSITPHFNGTTLESLTVGASSNTKAAAGTAANQANMLQVSVNHLQKRLGELRESAAAEDGVWARTYGGKICRNSTHSEADYQGLQLGYDKNMPVRDGRRYIGGALSYTQSDDSFTRGSGQSKATDVALYQTWLGSDGHYYDLIAKRGRLSSNYQVSDLSGTLSGADYDTWTDSLSAEVGYRKQLANNWYVEPQAELTYGRIHGVSYTTSSGMRVRQDGINRLIGRLGVGAGKKLANGSQVYGTLSVLHEFQGEQNTKADSLDYAQDLGGTWYECILGVSAKLSDHSNGYLNVEKLFGGDYSSNVQLNAGCRWNF